MILTLLERKGQVRKLPGGTACSGGYSRCDQTSIEIYEWLGTTPTSRATRRTGKASVHRTGLEIPVIPGGFRATAVACWAHQAKRAHRSIAVGHGALAAIGSSAGLPARLRPTFYETPPARLASCW